MGRSGGLRVVCLPCFEGIDRSRLRVRKKGIRYRDRRLRAADSRNEELRGSVERNGKYPQGFGGAGKTDVGHALA